MSSTVAASIFGNDTTRLPRWANTLLVIGIGVALATLTLRLLPGPDPVLPQAAAAGNVNASQQAPDPLTLAKVIATTHVFGNAAAAPVAVEEVKAAPPKETSLNLQLAGVFAFEPQEHAFAIISAGSGEQNAYGVGDKISGETALKAVYAEYVLLDNRGQEEILRLPDNVAPSAVGMQPIQSAQASANSGQQSSGDLSQPVELPQNPGELRDTLARNPSMLGRIVAAEPYQENGKLVGYRITPKQNPEILEAQGILAGDVITRVNNIQLNSQKQGIRALRNAVKAENLEVMILRDGVEVPISISLAQ